ncbi:sulfotransferase [Marinobacteraceae bacterium S3BR75-40.1]
MSRVNLFVVGAMKSGSTTLHEYLERHPAIYMSPEKEPGFFVPELWNGRGEDEYKALFENAGQVAYRGESSTHYTKLPTYTGVAERICRYNPEARIIYVMRDPIKRLFSHYRHAVRDLHFYGETRPIIQAIEKDPMYVAYSDYAMQLKPYLELFGKEQVYTLTFEDLVSNTQEEMAHIFDWLGIDKTFEIGETIAANQAPQRFKKARGRGVLNRLRYSSGWGVVAGLVPKRLRKLGTKLSETEATDVLTAEDKEAVRLRLKAYFEERITELERLTSRHYNRWEL